MDKNTIKLYRFFSITLTKNAEKTRGEMFCTFTAMNDVTYTECRIL